MGSTLRKNPSSLPIDDQIWWRSFLKSYQVKIV